MIRDKVNQLELISAINRELSRQGFALLTPREFGVVIDCATRIVDAIGPPVVAPDGPPVPRPGNPPTPAADAAQGNPGASDEGVNDAR